MVVWACGGLILMMANKIDSQPHLTEKELIEGMVMREVREVGSLFTS